MTLKTDGFGWLLNAQFFLSGIAIFLPKPLRKGVWLCVAPLATVLLAWRWCAVAHPPMQNLFEAFLWLPLFLTCMTAYSLWRDRCDTSRMDAFLCFFVTFPLAFVFNATPGQLPPALQSPLFVPHVLDYMLAYTLLARSFLFAWSDHTVAARENAAWGFAFITFSLALGSCWGNEAWGTYWQWDPKEQWSLATWFVYAAYFHVQHRLPWRRTLLTLGVFFILLTVTWINLSKLFSGMHSYAGV